MPASRKLRSATKLQSLPLTAYHVTGSGPRSSFFAIDPESQALGAATGFQELVQLQFPDCKAARLEFSTELHTIGRCDNRATNHDRVATETDRFIGGYFDQVGYVFSNDSLSVIVKRWGVPGCCAGFDRTKAGIEVIEPRIDELNWQCLTAQHLGNVLVTAHVTSNAISTEECRAGEQRI